MKKMLSIGSVVVALVVFWVSGLEAQERGRGKGGGKGGGGPRINKPRIEDTVRANIYADNWFVMYISGKLATADSIPFIPHNVVSVDLLPEYPMTIAVMARDNADPDTGMEYDSTNIGDGGFVLKFGDGTVTSGDWKARNFFHGPVDGDTANPSVQSEAIPRDWYATDFDDSEWANAVEYTEEAVGPKQPYYDHDFEGAKFIWSEDLALDNTVIFRTRVEGPPNGGALPPDWPRGHIVPSATVAPAVKDASLEGATETSGVEAIASGATARLAATSGSKWAGAPVAARVFQRFEDDLKIDWDEEYVYVEGGSLPDHEMMVGITAWNQQVPLPQDFTGENRWKLTLHPERAAEPVSGKESLFKGAIAVAANGVPIFNPIKQDGRTDTNLAGELDEYGGHAGRGDDYHYHLPPTFLNEEFGDELPIGYAMDGYALYGFNEPDGERAEKLDELNGHEHGVLGYHYHATEGYPYLNGGFRGKVALREGQVAEQPRTRGVRPYTRPLRGAEITGYEKVGENAYRLEYEVGGGMRAIEYAVREDGSVAFEFIDEGREAVSEVYSGRGGGGGARGERRGPGGGGKGRPPR